MASPLPHGAMKGRRVLTLAPIAAIAALAIGHLLSIRAPLGERVAAMIDRASAPRVSLIEERRQLFSTEYLAAIDAIARQVPAQAEYGLLDVQVRETGGAYWVAYDLAPRRPVFLGRLHHPPLTWPSPERPLSAYVLAGEGFTPPRLLDEAGLAAFLESQSVGPENR